MNLETPLEQLLGPLKANVEFREDTLTIKNKHTTWLNISLGAGCLLAVLYLVVNIVRQFQENGQVDWFEVGLAGLFLASALFFFQTQNKQVILDRGQQKIYLGVDKEGIDFADIENFTVEDQRYYANYLYTHFQAVTKTGKRVSLFRFNNRKVSTDFPQKFYRHLKQWMYHN